jgi:cold shock CspA family protein
MKMLEGVVDWFNLYKGFGFINVGDDKRVYFWKKQIVDAGVLYRGDVVKFQIMDSKKGPFAKRVCLVSRQLKNKRNRYGFF